MVKGLIIGLQSSSNDVIQAHRQVELTKQTIQKARDQVDVIHSQWFQLASDKAGSAGTDLSVLPRMCNQRSHTSSTESPSDYYKRTITIPFCANIQTLLQILCTLPVTSCACERSISTLRLI